MAIANMVTAQSKYNSLFFFFCILLKLSFLTWDFTLGMGAWPTGEGGWVYIAPRSFVVLFKECYK